MPNIPLAPFLEGSTPFSLYILDTCIYVVGTIFLLPIKEPGKKTIGGSEEKEQKKPLHGNSIASVSAEALVAIVKSKQGTVSVWKQP